MYHLTFETIQTKKRVNSKTWDFAERNTYIGLRSILNEPKKRALHRIVTEIPDSIKPSEVEKRWNLVDMTLTPLFFTHSYQLGCSYEALVKATEEKIQNKTNYASLTISQLKL